ncbi:hypothetical protein D3C87_1476820 [compost metagenome]
MPGPAMATMNFTFGLRLATIGAIMPPSLCPISPILIFFNSGRESIYFTAASASSAKSAVVALLKMPVDLPIPRSSYLNTAIPCLVR